MRNSIIVNWVGEIKLNNIFLDNKLTIYVRPVTPVVFIHTFFVVSNCILYLPSEKYKYIIFFLNTCYPTGKIFIYLIIWHCSFYCVAPRSVEQQIRYAYQTQRLMNFLLGSNSRLIGSYKHIKGNVNAL